MIDPLRERFFRRITLYTAIGVALPMSIGSFFMINALENLGYSKLGANVVFIGVGGLSAIASSRLWGRAVDRWGRRPVLMLAGAGTMLSATPWFFVTRHTPAPGFLADGLNAAAAALGGLFAQPGWQAIGPATPAGAYVAGTIACVIGGACWTGVHLARLGVMLAFSDSEGRSKYVAAMSVMFGLGGTVGGLAGGGLAWALQGVAVHVGPFFWRNWHAVFLLSILARASGLWLLVGMHDPGARRFRDMARGMGDAVAGAVANGLFLPLRIFGRRRNGRNGNRAGRGRNSGRRR
jgi:MFS family permease